MTTKLIQKHLIKGTQQLELFDDRVEVYIKAPFKEENLTVMLAVLNPEPVINKSRLDFNSRVNGEPLLSLFLANPNAEEFNAFVSELKQKATDEYNTFSGMKSHTQADQATQLGNNVYDEPPEFEEVEDTRVRNTEHAVDVAKIDEAIQMLETYVGSDEIKPLLSALTELKTDPASPSLLAKVAGTFNELGLAQGAVLTYAPYIIVLLSDDPFNSL